MDCAFITPAELNVFEAVAFGVTREFIRYPWRRLRKGDNLVGTVDCLDRTFATVYFQAFDSHGAFKTPPGMSSATTGNTLHEVRIENRFLLKAAGTLSFRVAQLVSVLTNGRYALSKPGDFSEGKIHFTFTKMS
jgi:hypothetical protein